MESLQCPPNSHPSGIAERDSVLTNRVVNVLIIWIISLVVVPSAQALRPYLSTENAIPISRGKSRVEIGFFNERLDSNNSGYGLIGELTYGLINNMDFEVEVPYRFLIQDNADNEDGLADVKLKTKIRFVRGREANPLSIAGQFILKLPSCNDDKKLSIECTGEVDVGGVAIASKEFFPVAVHLNLGYFLIGNPPRGELDDILKYSLAFDFQTPYEPVRILSELAGETHREPKADSDYLSLLLGLIYSVDLEKFVDLALSIGLTKQAPDYILTFGYTYHF